MTTKWQAGAKQQTKKIVTRNLELSSPKIVQGKTCWLFVFLFLLVTGKAQNASLAWENVCKNVQSQYSSACSSGYDVKHIINFHGWGWEPTTKKTHGVE